MNSRSSIASMSRATSVRWSTSVGSSSSTYRFCSAGRRITWRPTPTVAALGRVVSGGTSTFRSRVALTRQASRQPAPICSVVNVFTSCRVIGSASPSIFTLHLWQVPWPPQVESIAMPFQDAASKTVTPGGTRTPRSVGGASSVCCTVNASWTRPVPSCAAWSTWWGSRSPSRVRSAERPSARSKSGRRPFMRSMRTPRVPAVPGARRSSCRPTRRGPAGGRPP